MNAIGHRFDGPWLFRNVSADLQPGSLVGLVGPSGSGKSTLLAILADTLHPLEGTVERGRIEVAAWINQKPHGTERRTVRDHIALPLLAAGGTRRTAEKQIPAIARMFGLESLLDAPYRQLSGGEAQRLMLARALAMRPGLILADEPTASLDRANARGVVAVLDRLCAAGAVVVMATHDPLARQACDVVIDLGTSVA